MAGRLWTTQAALIIHCEDTRNHARNRDIARQRLVDLVRKAPVKPKRRIATRPTPGSKKHRLKAKRERGEVKTLRGRVGPEG